MDRAFLRGQLEATVEGDEDQLGQLAMDIRRILMDLRADILPVERDARIADIVDQWPGLDWGCVDGWIKLYWEQKDLGRDQELLDWLMKGAPEDKGQPIGLPEPEAIAC